MSYSNAYIQEQIGYADLTVFEIENELIEAQRNSYFCANDIPSIEQRLANARINLAIWQSVLETDDEIIAPVGYSAEYISGGQAIKRSRDNQAMTNTERWHNVDSMKQADSGFSLSLIFSRWGK